MARQPRANQQPAVTAHSYLHSIRKNGLHPYIKWPRAAQPPSSWSVPDLCAAYDWPKSAPGGSVIAIIDLAAVGPRPTSHSSSRTLSFPSPHHGCVGR